ncbi:MAG: thioredoxin [Pseudomonadales bacterium]|nr:thioredoxin [Pseudomonadales bacterium]
MTDAKGVAHLTKNDFQKTLDEAAKMPVLVDFYAEWCGPCKLAAPIIEELGVEYDGKAVIAKVNVDEQNQLAAEHGVMSIPTVIVFVNGQEVDRKIGFAGKDGYVAMIKDAMDGEN